MKTYKQLEWQLFNSLTKHFGNLGNEALCQILQWGKDNADKLVQLKSQSQQGYTMSLNNIFRFMGEIVFKEKSPDNILELFGYQYSEIEKIYQDVQEFISVNYDDEDVLLSTMIKDILQEFYQPNNPHYNFGLLLVILQGVIALNYDKKDN